MIYIAIQTLLVYSLIFVVMYYCCNKAYYQDNFKYVLFAILFYSIIFGLRYGVGRDCISYLTSYNDVLNGAVEDRFERAFVVIEEAFASFKAPNYIFMGFLSFMQLLFVFLYFKDKKEYLSFIVITFILGCTWLTYANGIRQILSFCLFFYSLKFAEERKILIHYGLLLCAYLMHGSALILVLFYPLLIKDYDWAPSRKWQFILFFLAIVAGRIAIINDLMGYIDSASSLLGYQGYMDERYAEKLSRNDLQYGIGYYINILIPLLLIWKSDEVKEEVPFARMFYNFYFVGLLLRFAFLSSSLIQRINYYFYGFDFIIAAFTLYYLLIYEKKNEYYILIALEVLVFVGTLSNMFGNSSAFYFLWQEQDFNRYSLPFYES